ncbi:hypothetical protein KKA14_19605, partial [bacterium]|nr:hypothetical protein [bacterium]
CTIKQKHEIASGFFQIFSSRIDPCLSLMVNGNVALSTAVFLQKDFQLIRFYPCRARYQLKMHRHLVIAGFESTAPGK